MASLDAHAVLSADKELTALAHAHAAASMAASALSAGEKSVENASTEAEKPHVEAPVASTCAFTVVETTTPNASGSGTAASATVAECTEVKTEPDTTAAGDGDAGERREDGYVTPPLRVGYVSDYVKLQQQKASTPSLQTPKQPRTSEEQRAAGVHPAGSSYSKLAPRESQHSVGLFTPILFAAQPLGGGGILSPTSNKRKRIEPSRQGAHHVEGGVAGGKSDERATRRKVSSDYLRKGQWTVTEEKFARALIDAFEEGYLPIYTGIRLRGYLAVQLQCDPMRISKKLCGGSVDGKKIPKNYGQKKFKLRKKQNWNYEDAARILVTLEQLMHELWSESGVSRPAFLTLSSTRNADDEGCPNSSVAVPVHMACDEEAAAAVPSSPEPDCDSSPAPSSPIEADVKKEVAAIDNAALPIIYLNLSRKHKKQRALLSSSSRSADTPQVSKPFSTVQDIKVDGDSLQAAYELLKLFQTQLDGETADAKCCP